MIWRSHFHEGYDHTLVKVNLGSSFDKNYDWPESSMLHTKFCGKRSTGRFLKGFYHIYMGMAAIFVM